MVLFLGKLNLLIRLVIIFHFILEFIVASRFIIISMKLSRAKAYFSFEKKNNFYFIWSSVIVNNCLRVAVSVCVWKRFDFSEDVEKKKKKIIIMLIGSNNVHKSAFEYDLFLSDSQQIRFHKHKDDYIKTNNRIIMWYGSWHIYVKCIIILYNKLSSKSRKHQKQQILKDFNKI